MITMNENNRPLSDDSLSKVRQLFDPEALLSVKDIEKATGLKTSTVRTALKVLKLGRKIEERGYLPKKGKVYAPVAETDFSAIRLGESSYTVEGLLAYIRDNRESPNILVSESAWNKVRKLILFSVYKGSTKIERPATNDQINYAIEVVENEARNLLKLVASLKGREFTDPDVMMSLGGEVDSISGSDNLFYDVLREISEGE
jgi:hypothetical protein